MTIAISIATRAKYHEAINIIEIDRTTPITERILNLKKNDGIQMIFSIDFTNDNNENVVANWVLSISFVMHKLNSQIRSIIKRT
jgi:hypothetical protein